MWIVAILALAAVALWYGNKRRGQRFVRAVHYLDLLDNGVSIDEANGKVARLFSKHSTPDADVTAIELATDRANRFTGGKHLPWIDEARRQGFNIDSGNTRFDMAHLSRAVPEANSGQSSVARPALSETYQAGLHRVGVSASKLVPVAEVFVDAAIRCASRGALAGFVLGFLAPRGLFGSLELWAIPIVTGFLGALIGLVIGAAYYALRWVVSR